MAAKKKVVKKKVARKVVSKKVVKPSKVILKKEQVLDKKLQKPVVKPVRQKKHATSTVRAGSRKISVVIKNLVFFSVLMIVSLSLYSVSGSLVYQNLFILLTMLSGFVVLAFLLVLLILVFLRLLSK